MIGTNDVQEEFRNDMARLSGTYGDLSTESTVQDRKLEEEKAVNCFMIIVMPAVLVEDLDHPKKGSPNGVLIT